MTGFRVNVTALDDAAAGVSGTLSLFTQRKVSDITFDHDAVGDDDLAGAVGDFLSGWQRGVNNLAKDGQQIADRLTGSAAAYRKADGNGKDVINGVFAGTGKDPAATAR